jgi:2,4-dienoyl-CoA reductase-like NADH-dependent reductase (Old Yellow Enzyme family)/thioredoxin reductase
MTGWKLLEPIRVGSMFLKNRIVMPPMSSRLAAPDGSVTTRMIEYYSERAKGGVGLIVIEYSFIDGKESRSSVCQLGVHNDHMIAGLGELAEAVKSYGAGVVIQICHGGRQSTPAAMGRRPLAPSAIPCKLVNVVPRELTLNEIEEIQEAFAEAARRAKLAGFDGVELHGAHGYLICEFLSPYTNKRSDKYGGSLENRALFALETINKVREKVGTHFTVGCRINADDFVPGGLTPQEAVKFAKMLEEASIDYIHVSGGINETQHCTINPTYIERGSLLHLADAVKKSVNLPVIAVGSLDVETAEKAIRDGKADLVALGRALIADPEIPKKLIEGRIEDIRPCIRGNEGCISRFFEGRSLRCEVNPATGREREFRVVPTSHRKKVLIIGGGAAGMEAARVSALRGHDVTLIEKEEKLGGHLVEASVPNFKSDIKILLNWLSMQVSKVGVEVKLKTEATPDIVKEIKPDVLIIAVGSDYIVPAVPGINEPHVATSADVLLGKKTIGNRAVVIGGGLVGCETALFIAEELKKTVAVVEMLDDILIGVEPISARVLRRRLREAGVSIHTQWSLKEIKRSVVECVDKLWRTHMIEADTIVIAVGLSPRKDMVEKFDRLAPEVYVIGDCVQARKIYHAFEDAWKVAFSI